MARRENRIERKQGRCATRSKRSKVELRDFVAGPAQLRPKRGPLTFVPAVRTLFMGTFVPGVPGVPGEQRRSTINERGRMWRKAKPAPRRQTVSFHVFLRQIRRGRDG